MQMEVFNTDLIWQHGARMHGHLAQSGGVNLGTQIFLSAVSDEFRSYREVLRHGLDNPRVTVKIQEDLEASGTTALEKLDDYIQNCDAVIHLVGDATGSFAQFPGVEALLRRCPSLARVGELRPFLTSGGSLLSYTQWEAWLAVAHQKPLLIATPTDDAGGEVERSEEQRDMQRRHLALLRRQARHVEIKFRDSRDLLQKLLSSKLMSIIERAGKRVPSEIPRVPIHFFGRTQELVRLNSILLDPDPQEDPSESRSRATVRHVALQGLGGIGKSSLAAMYATKQAKVYDEVVWCNAEHLDTLLPALARIARAKEIAGDATSPSDLARAALRHVSSRSRDERWLLVYDNVETPRKLEDWFPESHVPLLITSQFRGWGANETLIELTDLAEPEAIGFLMSRCNVRKGAEESGAGRLVSLLGGHCLALEIAAATCMESGIDFFEYSDQLADRLTDQLPEGAGTKRSVDETFKMAMKRASERCPEAGDLLSYLAFCGGAPISIDILSGAMEDERALRASVAALRRFSLISDHTYEDGRPAVVVHRLVQEYWRQLAEAAGKGNELQNRLVSQLLKLYPADGYEEVASWDRCEELTPHALVVWRRTNRPPEDEPICSLINLVGLYYLGRSELDQADQLLSAVLAIRDRNPSTAPENLSLSLHNLALLRDYQSQLPEAYELCSRAYRIREETGDPLLSWTVNNLAYLLLEMGRYADALPYSIKNIEMTKEEYLPDFPAELATALDNHAVLLMRMRDLDEARRYCVEALEIRARVREQPHSDTALSHCHLGQIMTLQGQVEQGEEELNTSIDMYARTIGQRHVDMAEAIGSLGDAVRDRDPRGARKLYLEAIAIYSDKGVERHHDAVRSYVGLGQLEEAFGAVSEARRLYTLAYSILEEKVGREHPETQQCLARLAQLKPL